MMIDREIAIDGLPFVIRDSNGSRSLIALGSLGPLLSVVIGIVTSQTPQAPQALENIRRGSEYADGYVWYGPIDSSFDGDEEYECWKANWEKENGRTADEDIWGIKADWENGTAFLPHSTLTKILDLAVRLQKGESIDIPDLAK